MRPAPRLPLSAACRGKLAMSNAAPLLWIGATGGSGTRALVAALAALGVFPGRDLNDSRDALPMTAVYDRHLPAYLAGANFDLAAWRADLAAALSRHAAGLAPDVPCLVKNPRAIFMPDLLLDAVPASRFLQVVRNGVAMAFSANQRQLQQHGRAMLGSAWVGESPAAQSLRLWSLVNLRGREVARRYPGRCALVRYEDFCARPAQELARIGAELDIALDLARLDPTGIAPSSRPLPEDWRAQLGDALAAARPALAAFGYEC